MPMKKVVSGTLLAIFAVLFYSCTFHREASTIASKITVQSEDTFSVSSVVGGDWDFACVISETARPETVALQVAQKTLMFERVGNSNRNLLYDGESGLVLVSNKRGTYALYLVFDENKIVIIHNNGPQCLPFKRASLVETLKEEQWRYLELLDCGRC